MTSKTLNSCIQVHMLWSIVHLWAGGVVIERSIYGCTMGCHVLVRGELMAAFRCVCNETVAIGNSTLWLVLQ